MKKIIMLILWGVFTSFTAFNAAALTLEVEDYISLDDQFGLYSRSDMVVRSAPNSQAEKVGVLRAGYNLKVLEYADKEIRHGINLNWLKISFRNDDSETQEGYVWAGEIIPTILPLDYETSIVRGQPTNLADERLMDKLLIVRNGVEIDSLLFMNLSGGNSNLRITDDSQDIYFQFEGQNKIIRISSSGEACAVPSYDHYFGWNRTSGKLTHIISTTSAGDETFSHYEHVFFPHNGASSNTLIKFVHEWDGDLTAEPSLTLSDDYATEIYYWDGKSLTSIKQNPLVLKGYEE